MMQFAVGVSIVLVIATIAGLFVSNRRKSISWKKSDSKLDETLIDSMDCSDATATY